MCGHVGIFGTGISTKHVSALEDLLLMDTLRGEHATGICRIGLNNNIEILKKSVPAWDFLKDKEWSKVASRGVSAIAIMGHNRFATEGGLTDDNAHPFQHEHIVMAHNGTLRSRRGLSGTAKDFEVDSNHVAYTLSQKSPTEFLPDINGAYALVWHDATTNTLNFVRNHERPMYIAKVKDVDVFMYASEPWMLHAAAKRKRRNIEFESVDELPTLTIRKFQLGKSFTEKVVQLEDEKYTTNSYTVYSDWDYQGTRGNRGVYRGKSTYVNRGLATYNLSMNDLIKFTPVDFAAYNRSRTTVRGEPIDPALIYGTLIGYCDDHPFFDVTVSGISQKDADEYISKCASTQYSLQGCVTGTSTDATYDDGTKVSPDPSLPQVIMSFRSVKVVKVGKDAGGKETSNKKSSGNIIEHKAVQQELIDKEDDIPFDQGNEDTQEKKSDGNTLIMVGKYNRRGMSIKRFNEITRYGCGMCGADIFQEDCHKITLLDSDGVLCEGCTEKTLS